MARRRRRAGLDDILNLDSLVDVVTNTNGMLILLAVFTTLLAIGKAYTLSFPIARVTEQEPVFFECRDQRVIPLATRGGYGDAYDVVPLGFATLLVPREGVHGETAGELLRADSAFRREVAAMDPTKQYAAFVVRSDGFEAFRAARELLAEIDPGLGVGWEPMPAERQIVFGSGGRPVPPQ